MRNPEDEDEFEKRFPGDLVEQVIARTLWDRGNEDMDAIEAAMDKGYNYDDFGKIVDRIEDLIHNPE